MKSIKGTYQHGQIILGQPADWPEGTEVLVEPIMAPAEAPAETMEERFRRLAAAWHRETGMLSSFSKKIQHPAYREIIAMGEAVVPLILRELRDSPDHWFVALKAITKQTPVPAQDRTDPKKVREAWLNWGRERGYLE